jgi:hypothetical protein
MKLFDLLSKKNCIQLIKSNDILLNELINHTKFLPEDSPVQQRVWHLKNNLFHRVLCEICLKNNAKFDKKHNLYRCCSKECSKIKISKNSKSNHEITKQKIANTILQKFGTDNYAKTNEFKNFLKQNSIFKSDEFKEKRKKVIKEKYGVEHPLLNKDIKNKFIATSLKNYGVEHPLSSKELRSKFKKVKYSKEQIDSIKRKLNEYYKNKFCKEYLEDYSLIEFGDYLKLTDKKCEHTFEISRLLFHLRKQRNHVICTICNPISHNKSHGQDQLIQWLKELNLTLEINNRTILNGKGLDIYIPNHNLAIEFNSLYWHCELFKSKYYHFEKSNLCEQNNIKLLHIREDHWLEKNEIVKEIILSHLNIQTKANFIFARKCEILDVSIEEEKLFLEDNHLQGYNPSTVCYGLYYNGKLVQLMSFVKRKDYWEIQRLCTKKRYKIVGGTSKLWNHFLNNNSLTKIITYSSRDYFTGKVYEKLGMSLEKITEPGFSYTNGKEVYDRRKFQKKNIVKFVNNLGISSNLDNKSINIIANNLNFYRIYNSGNYKYVFNNQS